MSNFLFYLTEVNIVFSVFYLVYYLFFRRLTYHRLNRTFLLTMLPLSFIFPVLNLGLSPSIAGELAIPGFEEFVLLNQPEIVSNSDLIFEFSISRFLIMLYFAGLGFYVFRLVLSVLKLISLKRQSQVSIDNGFYIISARVPLVFSCFNWIFVPEHDPGRYEDPVIEHEKLHATLGHTLDLIITELCIALLWFNPFVFFFRKSLKSVHEYQVDALMVKSTLQKSFYLKLMLDNLESNYRLSGLYNYFNGKTIKNRINMITKNKSSKTQLLRYAVLLPVIAFLAMSFSKNSGELPELFPVNKNEYKKITVYHGQKMIHPFSKQQVIHNGLDISAVEGVSVMATAGGKVIKASNEEGWGNLIIIAHGDGVESWYAHLKDFSVTLGQKVRKGETIGHVGNTGLSTGPHLHFEIRLNTNSVNPLDYVKQ
ncbi:MAG: peptidoglycan DD-metalloendopeptidase family protein [Bacteroidales bacterium]|nr:peptidoglycan DD-metalloendopeptidase family protein [Bacteroidales bacterium]